MKEKGEDIMLEQNGQCLVNSIREYNHPLTKVYL